MRVLPSLSTAAALVAAALTVAACADADTKSMPDDQSSTTAGSTISNAYTTIAGELPLDTAVADTIDYPEYYLGRTLELHAGQAIELTVASSRKSLVHVYGPATGWAGAQPLFGDALAQTVTALSAGKQRAQVDFTAPAAGTYMVVYGPLNVWKASYALRATCVSGCEPVAAEGEACGGGFRPPAPAPATCAPELTCVAPYAMFPDASGRCGAMTTVAELLANPAAFDGRYVAINGVVATAPARCTMAACPATSACCNTCSAEQRLFDIDVQAATLRGVTLDEGGATLGCSGDSCTYQDHCTIADGGQWVSGWFTAAGTSLDVDRRYATP